MILYFLIFCSLLGITCGSCQNGFVQYGSSCYYLSLDSANWDDARDTCITKYNADLVDIESREEATFVYSLIATTTFGHFWLGGRRDEHNNWHWVRSGKNITFSDWESGLPDQAGNVPEDCMESVPVWHMKWNDIKCSLVHRGYICESSVAPTPDPGEVTDKGITLGLCPHEFVQHGSSCYYLSQTGANWDAARNTCTSKYNADLVDIESKEESEFVYSMIADTNIRTLHVWLGAKRDQHNNWYWVRTGKNLTFADWEPGLPDQAGNVPENCIESVVEWHMKWNDLKCGYTHLRFICESR